MAFKRENVSKDAQRIKRIIRSVMIRLEIEGYLKLSQSAHSEDSNLKNTIRKRGL